MAKATVNRQDPAPVPPIVSVTLELTPEEAQVLVDITDFIGGDSCKSRRKFSDAIRYALMYAGINPPDRVNDISRGVQRIYFENIF
jgi:hypothetical protein